MPIQPIRPSGRGSVYTSDPSEFVAATLAAMGKTEFVLDLNPLSRSAQVADVPTVDDLVRAVPNGTAHAETLAGDEDTQRAAIDASDADEARADAERTIRGGDCSYVRRRPLESLPAATGSQSVTSPLAKVFLRSGVWRVPCVVGGDRPIWLATIGGRCCESSAAVPLR